MLESLNDAMVFGYYGTSSYSLSTISIISVLDSRRRHVRIRARYGHTMVRYAVAYMDNIAARREKIVLSTHIFHTAIYELDFATHQYMTIVCP